MKTEHEVFSRVMAEVFPWWDFRCRCGCDYMMVSPRLVVAYCRLVLDILPAGTPLVVNSGYRCTLHNNTIVGASPRSRHLWGEAIDLHSDEVSPSGLAQAAEAVAEFREGGIGVYPWGVHLDVRRKRARWGYRGRQRISWEKALREYV